MLRLLALAVLAILAPWACSAAEIKLISSAPIAQARIARGECTASLVGLIQEGDAAKIAALPSEGTIETGVTIRFEANAKETDPNQPKARALCLTDSGGGSFLEGLKMAELFRSDGWVTVVPRNGRCLSACAVAFLGGSLLSSNSNGGERAPFRVMDVSATVGFHSPYFPDGIDPNNVVPFSLVLQFLQEGSAAIQKLRATLSEDDFPSAGPALPATLIVDMLSHVGGDNFAYVDTVDKAGAYNIRLAGVPAVPVDADTLYRLCDNAVSWAFGLHNPGDSALTSWSYELCKANKNKDADCIPPGGGKALADNLRRGVTVNSRHQLCSINGGPNIGDDYQVNFQRVNGTAFDRSFEPWATLPHYVPLADLASFKGGVDLRAYRELKPFSKHEPGSVGLPAFVGALPGHVLVADAKDGGTNSLIMNFLKNGTVEILWPEGSIDKSPYRLTADGACFSGIKGHREPVCARMKSDENGDGWFWSFGMVYPDVIVRFQRPGRVIPLSAQEPNR